MDHVTHCVSQNPVGTSCADSVQQIHAMELEGYSRWTCSNEPRRFDHHTCRQPAQSAMSFLDNMIDIPWRNF